LIWRYSEIGSSHDPRRSGNYRLGGVPPCGLRTCFENHFASFASRLDMRVIMAM
jgi:hypothetical protein